ncbi:MAG: HAD family hydrolase [Pseudomonadota bacterium]
MMDLQDSRAVFARYEALRGRLPQMPVRTAAPVRVRDLSAVFDRYDAFILDGFGVLNVGGSAIEGAPERVAAMRAAGKRVIVLTNAATFPAAGSVAKYRGLGFDFEAGDIVSSRDVAVAGMAGMPALRWGATAAGAASLEGLDAIALEDDDAAYEAADAFLYLSGDAWTPARQARLAAALCSRPRPVVVANPDLVAPRETALSVEPGAWAHALMDSVPGLDVAFYGKPFGNAFCRVMSVLGDTAPEPSRIAMVGDTLHTDILGGAAAGWGTVLITGHGILKGHDPEPFVSASGIVPDVIAQTT